MLALPPVAGRQALRRFVGKDFSELVREIEADKARKEGSDKPTQVKPQISGGSDNNAGDAPFEDADAD